MNLEPIPKPEKRLNYKQRAASGLITRKPRKALEKKTRLKPVSAKRQSWLELYKRQKDGDHIFQMCPVCAVKGRKEEMDAHHTHGRSGENILRYIWVHRVCHDWIHGNPNKARERGFLFF